MLFHSVILEFCLSFELPQEETALWISKVGYNPNDWYWKQNINYFLTIFSTVQVNQTAEMAYYYVCFCALLVFCARVGSLPVEDIVVDTSALATVKPTGENLLIYFCFVYCFFSKRKITKIIYLNCTAFTLVNYFYRNKTKLKIVVISNWKHRCS